MSLSLTISKLTVVILLPCALFACGPKGVAYDDGRGVDRKEVVRDASDYVVITLQDGTQYDKGKGKLVIDFPSGQTTPDVELQISPGAGPTWDLFLVPPADFLTSGTYVTQLTERSNPEGLAFGPSVYSVEAVTGDLTVTMKDGQVSGEVTSTSPPEAAGTFQGPMEVVCMAPVATDAVLTPNDGSLPLDAPRELGFDTPQCSSMKDTLIANGLILPPG